MSKNPILRTYLKRKELFSVFDDHRLGIIPHFIKNKGVYVTQAGFFKLGTLAGNPCLYHAACAEDFSPPYKNLSVAKLWQGEEKPGAEEISLTLIDFSRRYHVAIQENHTLYCADTVRRLFRSKTFSIQMVRNEAGKVEKVFRTEFPAKEGDLSNPYDLGVGASVLPKISIYEGPPIGKRRAMQRLLGSWYEADQSLLHGRHPTHENAVNFFLHRSAVRLQTLRLWFGSPGARQTKRWIQRIGGAGLILKDIFGDVLSAGISLIEGVGGILTRSQEEKQEKKRTKILEKVAQPRFCGGLLEFSYTPKEEKGVRLFDTAGFYPNTSPSPGLPVVEALEKAPLALLALVLRDRPGMVKDYILSDVKKNVEDPTEKLVAVRIRTPDGICVIHYTKEQRFVLMHNPDAVFGGESKLPPALEKLFSHTPDRAVEICLDLQKSSPNQFMPIPLARADSEFRKCSDGMGLWKGMFENGIVPKERWHHPAVQPKAEATLFSGVERLSPAAKTHAQIYASRQRVWSRGLDPDRPSDRRVFQNLLVSSL